MFADLVNKFREIIKSPIRSKHVKYGVPFFFFMGFAFLGLREFTTVRYEFRRYTPLDRNEIRESGIKIKEKPVTLEESYEKIKEIDIDNWENIRGPRYLNENEEEEED